MLGVLKVGGASFSRHMFWKHYVVNSGYDLNIMIAVSQLVDEFIQKLKHDHTKNTILPKLVI